MKKAKFYLPVILWCLLIFILSSRQRVQVSDNYWYNFAFFKLLHMIEYGTLFVLWYRVIINTTSIAKINSGFWALILTIIYAISDEVHQMFVPTREGTLRDVLIDTLGALLFWYGLWKLLLILPQRLRRMLKHLQIH